MKTSVIKAWPGVFLLLCVQVQAEEAVQQLPELEVIASRMPSVGSGDPFSIVEIDRDFIDKAPQRRLDDALRSVPGFSLFRRSSSRVAHPTTQGVSLRNIGPNGAGRTLVVYDGIPLNDPFGGWVYWNRLPMSGIGSVRVQQGGGAGAWGNMAISGVISMEPFKTVQNSVSVDASAGSHGTFDATLNLQTGNEKASGFFLANHYSTDGYEVVRKDQRGLVDNKAYTEASLYEGGFRLKLSEANELVFRASHFDEERGNGTVLTRNATEGYSANASFTHRGPTGDGYWRAQIYFQERDFNSLFSSVNADRSNETPALNQFDVPARAWGGSLVGSGRVAERHHLLYGVDTRWVDGETNEQFFFNGTSFNLQRKAGGGQQITGVFVEDTVQLSDSLRVTFGARGDYWKDEDGQRLRMDLNSGATIRNDQFEDRNRWVGNARIGFVYQADEAIQLSGLLYTGFRAPTLNELYRPFRVRSDITESNPELKPEDLFGGEVSLRWNTDGPFDVNLTYFRNSLEDAIANVTLAPGPGVIDPCGFVPNGGSCRQRRNLDEVESEGFEVNVKVKASATLGLSFAYLYSKARIIKSADQPFIEGNRLAQTPEHALRILLNWDPIPTWSHTVQLSYTSSQYENDTNSLLLDTYTLVDWSSVFALRDNVDIFLSIENVFNEVFETGRASNSIVSIGHPRMVTGGIRFRF